MKNLFELQHDDISNKMSCKGMFLILFSLLWVTKDIVPETFRTLHNDD